MGHSRLLLTGAGLMVAFVVGFGAYGLVAVQGDDARLVTVSDGRVVDLGASWPGAVDTCVDDPAIDVLPNCYRERIVRDSFVKQTWSTVSTVAFCAVGLAALATADRGRPGPLTRAELAWIGFVALFMGPASALFHGTLTVWGGWVDQLSLYALLGLIVGLEATRLTRQRTGIGSWFAGLVVLGVLLRVLTGDASTAAFGAAGVLVGVFVLVSWWRWLPQVGRRRDGRRLALAFAALFGALVPWGISNPAAGDPTDAPWHAAWHVLAAAFVGVFWWYAASERDAGVPA